jgi:hypothetical protein
MRIRNTLPSAESFCVFHIFYIMFSLCVAIVVLRGGGRESRVVCVYRYFKESQQQDFIDFFRLESNFLHDCSQKIKLGISDNFIYFLPTTLSFTPI